MLLTQDHYVAHCLLRKGMHTSGESFPTILLSHAVLDKTWVSSGENEASYRGVLPASLQSSPHSQVHASPSCSSGTPECLCSQYPSECPSDCLRICVIKSQYKITPRHRPFSDQHFSSHILCSYQCTFSTSKCASIFTCKTNSFVKICILDNKYFDWTKR